MDETCTQLVAASDTSCCSISKAPIPQLQNETSGLSLVAPIAVLGLTGDAPRIQRLVPVLIAPDLSPPRLQSLLCTFLI